MIILAAFGFFWNFAFLSQQNNVAFFILLVHYQKASSRLASALKLRRLRLRSNKVRFRNRLEVSASDGALVRDWDHISYFAFFSSYQSFWLWLTPHVLASLTPVEGEVLVEADYSPNSPQWPRPWYESWAWIFHFSDRAFRNGVYSLGLFLCGRKSRNR